MLSNYQNNNTLEKTMSWLEENEPQLAKEIAGKDDKIMDFKVMKHFAYASKETYNTDRWAVLGESGLFGDPFYSPGTDFITMANTFTGDLILRDFEGEDILFRTNFYAQLVRAVYENWMPIYVDQYSLWGSTQIMVAKIVWDWAAYWSVNTLLYVNKGLTNMELMLKVVKGPNNFMGRYGELTAQMQRLFKAAKPYDTDDLTDHYIDVFDLDFLKVMQEDIVEKQIGEEELLVKLVENLGLLEHIAAETFRLFSNKAHGTSMDIEVDPYTMSLDPNVTVESDNSSVLGRHDYIANEMKNMWLYTYPKEIEEPSVL